MNTTSNEPPNTRDKSDPAMPSSSLAQNESTTNTDINEPASTSKADEASQSTEEQQDEGSTQLQLVDWTKNKISRIKLENLRIDGKSFKDGTELVMRFLVHEMGNSHLQLFTNF